IVPKPKSSPSVEDDMINEPIVQDLNGSPSLQVNVSDEGYPKSVKEARGQPIEQVIVLVDLSDPRGKSNHGFLGVDSKGEIPYGVALLSERRS
ncbi:hypothetical protein Tco_0710913, partial [Tanacetum coccineum]